VKIVRSHYNTPIRLTDERWQHIVQRHPEMVTFQESVLETVSQPSQIQEGDYGTLMAIRFYAETPLTSKYLIVIYRETQPDDGFVLTAYLASKLSTRRKILWKS
jgi:hypothetical protein